MDDFDALSTPFELPRLHVIHLLMWTAAIGFGFVPYRLQLKAFERSGAIIPEQTSAMTGMSALFILAEGSLLFVAGAVVVWYARGYMERLEPGHHLALRAGFEWALMVAASALLYSGSANVFHMMVRILSLVASVAFFVWFLGLALRRDQSKPWRAAFAVLAAAPVLRAMLLLLERNVAVLSYGLFVSIFVTGIQLAAILPALISDWRRGPTRHWSHWLGTLARLLALGVMVVGTLWLWMHPSGAS